MDFKVTRNSITELGEPKIEANNKEPQAIVASDPSVTLDNNDISSAYGSRDMWQLVDQVSTFELGGAENTIRNAGLSADSLEQGAAVTNLPGGDASNATPNVEFPDLFERFTSAVSEYEKSEQIQTNDANENPPTQNPDHTRLKHHDLFKIKP